MRAFALSALVLLGCSSDDAPGQSAGLTGSSGTSQGGQAGTVSSAGASGQPSQGGASAAGGAAGTGGAQGGLGGVGGDSNGGAAGEPASGGKGGAASPSPAELGCTGAPTCVDGRAGYKCPSGVAPEGCAPYFTGAEPTYCCGKPSAPACSSSEIAGATRETATTTESVTTTIALPAMATGWLKTLGDAGSGQTSPGVSVYASSSPLVPGSVEVCVGYQCADGSDGVKSCKTGQKVVDGLTLCCLDLDFGSSGEAARAVPVCPNEGDRLIFGRFRSKVDACVDVKKISFVSFPN